MRFQFPHFSTSNLKTFNWPKMVSILILGLYANFSCAAGLDQQPTNNNPVIQQANEIVIDDINILQIDDEIKSLLDQHISPINSKIKRAEKLHSFLFTPAGLNIQYDSRFTRTAQQTYAARSGNCISHAALYIASARYVSMHARFQKVDVPRTWEKHDNFYIVPGHINAVINLPFNKITAEFISTYYFSNDEYHPKIISDKYALAEFYNNLGMEAMLDKQFDLALAYVKKSEGIMPKNDNFWSNLGVVYKFIDEPLLAEQAYLTALQYNKKNISVVKNLYILYHNIGQIDKANQLAKKVERYNKKNPYFLARMADTDISLNNLKSALTKISKAIRIAPEEEDFYVSLSQIHYKMGNLDESYTALNEAAKHAKNAVNNYQQKLNRLQAMNSKML